MRYFENEFLNAEDFIVEQEYHRTIRMEHNKALHGWGIAEGLVVTGQEVDGVRTVSITKGAAIDGLGREIILAEDRVIDVTLLSDATRYVVIQWAQQAEAPFQDSEHKRWEEIAVTNLVETLPQGGDEQITLILARIDISGSTVTVITDDRVEITSGSGVGLGTVDTDHLVDDAVTSAKIDDHTITLDNMDAAAVAELKEGNINEIKIVDEENPPVQRFSIQYKYNTTEAEHRLYLYYVSGTSYSYVAYIDQTGNLKVSGNIDADNI